MKSSDESYEFDWFGNNRHVCDVFEDMRRLEKTKNFTLLAGLIEEAQVMANRMESALRDQKDLIKLQGKISEARREYKKLEKEYKSLESKVKKVKSKSPDCKKV